MNKKCNIVCSLMFSLIFISGLILTNTPATSGENSCDFVTYKQLIQKLDKLDYMKYDIKNYSYIVKFKKTFDKMTNSNGQSPLPKGNNNIILVEVLKNGIYSFANKVVSLKKGDKVIYIFKNKCFNGTNIFIPKDIYKAIKKEIEGISA